MWRISDRRHVRRAQALSRAITSLPPTTRQAMLDAAQTEELIVGGYTDVHGRMCPMLAAHRRGARTTVGSFPHAWDAFARAARPRPASRRELDILTALLAESLTSAPSRDAIPGGGRGETHGREPERPTGRPEHRGEVAVPAGILDSR